MKVEEDKIESVLALFDREDIPYIKSDTYLEYINEINNNSKESVKVKKIGEKYDRKRK